MNFDLSNTLSVHMHIIIFDYVNLISNRLGKVKYKQSGGEF